MVQGLARLLSTQLELSELEQQTALACRMELKALQAQINPHFLFNTINTIAMLIPHRRRHRRATAPRIRLLLPAMLEDNEGPVPLRQELEYALTYLRFEQHGWRPAAHLGEPPRGDPRCSGPAFILQPLVENCVQHGAEPGRPLTITLEGARIGSSVIVRVIDDGWGFLPRTCPVCWSRVSVRSRHRAQERGR